MRLLYDDWRSGNKSKASFCRLHGLNCTTFHYWVKKFTQENNPATQDNGFSRISITPALVSESGSQPFATITFPSGVRLDFFSSQEASYLKSLLG